jgi:hypothetical protein
MVNRRVPQRARKTFEIARRMRAAMNSALAVKKMTTVVAKT